MIEDRGALNLVCKAWMRGGRADRQGRGGGGGEEHRWKALLRACLERSQLPMLLHARQLIKFSSER